MQLDPRVLITRSGATAVIHRITAAARAVVLGAALLGSGACYTYTTVPNTNRLTEQRAEFRFSDQGRVDMQRTLGPGALSIEGRIVGETDSAWNVKVYRLTNIDGHMNVWTGEEVEVPRTAVAIVSLRTFDRQRSVFAAAGVTGALAVFILTRGIIGGGLFGDGDDPGPVGESFRP